VNNTNSILSDIVFQLSRSRPVG